MIAATLNPSARVMMFAPHPDDESLAAGIFLQKAVARGAAVRVVYATDGDDNPWPQRALERKWRLNEIDRKRWGSRRRREAIAALETLGLRATDARFLGLPDQRLTDILLRDCTKMTGTLRRMIRDWSPTHLLMPSLADTHPDHSALAVLLRFALAAFVSRGDSITAWSYLVHGKRPTFTQAAYGFSQSGNETKRKRQAIRCHRSQVKFSRRRFMAYAKRPESFQLTLRSVPRLAGKAIRGVRRNDGKLRISIRLKFKPLRAEETKLYVTGHSVGGSAQSLRMLLPGRTARIQLTDCATGHRFGIANYRGNAFSGEITLSANAFASEQPLFVKLNRRSWFFDEAGWLEIAPEVPAQKAPILREPVTIGSRALAIR